MCRIDRRKSDEWTRCRSRQSLERLLGAALSNDESGPMAEIKYEQYECFNLIRPGEGHWHTFGPTNIMPSSRPATISITAVPFTYGGDPYTVLKVEDVHVTSYGLATRTHYGANVINAGPATVTYYRLGVTKIGDFPPPTPAVVAPGGTPGTVGEIDLTAPLLVMAIHNDAGQILSLIGRSPESAPAQLEMRWGQRATEIEVPELTRELDPAQILDLLSDLVENHQVEARGATGVLKRRSKR